MDRPRRLDKLFAEKVLGHGAIYDIPDPELGEVHTDDRWREWDDPKDTYGSDHILRPYTRSLDLAWPEFEKHSPVALWKRGLHYEAMIGVKLGDHSAPTMRGRTPCLYSEVRATADHPAEALVLACLKAVGCSDEELA